jgi:hypothetical protein
MADRGTGNSVPHISQIIFTTPSSKQYEMDWILNIEKCKANITDK